MMRRLESLNMDMANKACTADDPFLLKYQPSELRIASEFLSTWLPYLSRDLCDCCTETLSHRIRSLEPSEPDGGDVEPVTSVKTPDITESQKGIDNNDNNLDSQSLRSWKDGDEADANSLGSWKDGANELSELPPDASTSEPESSVYETPRLSWADMAQEDELEEEEELERKSQLVNGNSPIGEVEVSKVQIKPGLSRERREYIRFMSIKRKKDFICLERVNGKIVNILDGLELHTSIFSAAEQKRIVEYVYELQEMGKNRKFKERTYTAPQKWMRGKGRETIQFGCCYNYAMDRNGNPPGILLSETVDPIPHLFKVIIRRLIRWHVLPPACVPDSCIVNIYEEEDCIPPHIDNHDFVRPFCTVSFLSECDIVFGSNLKILGPGEFSGAYAIPLPVGSVLVLNGNGADVAKHCVPAVPTKRISITFRKMDESKRPVNYVPEPDLQGLQPLSYDVDKSKRLNPLKPQREMNRRTFRRDGNGEARGFQQRGGSYSNPRLPGRTGQGAANSRRFRVSLGS